MRVKAFTTGNLEMDSAKAAELAARAIVESFGEEKLRLVLVYGTINHEQSVLLESIRAVVAAIP